MINIIATILSSTSIYIIFRLAKDYSCKIQNLITINYLVASLFGFGFFLQFDLSTITGLKPLLPSGIVLGTLFIGMFFLIGNSSQKAGITITTLANKLSLVFPVLFSMLWFHESVSTFKNIGIFTAVSALFLTIYKKDIKKTNLVYIFLPFAIFIGSGITDSFVKYAQTVKIPPENSALFSCIVFFVAFILAAAISLIGIKSINIKVHSPTLILGVLLGLVNFGSLYFLINALNKSRLESSLVFTIVNISIVVMSSLVGTIFFKEKLNNLNITGIILAILSLSFLLL